MGEPQLRDCLLLYIATLPTLSIRQSYGPLGCFPFAVHRSPFGLCPQASYCTDEEVKEEGGPSLLDLLEAKHTNEALPNASVAGPCCWTELWKHRLTRASL